MAVEIENNTDWSFKDFEGVLGNVWALKRNDEESLLASQWPLVFFRITEIRSPCFFTQCPNKEGGSGSNFAVRMASRHVISTHRVTLTDTQQHVFTTIVQRHHRLVAPYSLDKWDDAHIGHLP